MLRVVTVVFSLLFSAACLAQHDRADSLEIFIRNSHEDTIKVQLLNQLVTLLRDRDTQKAFPYARQARDLSRILSYERGMGTALENLAWIHYRRGDYSKAFELSTEALRIFESLNDLAGVARCFNHIAAFQYEQKQFQHAIDNFKRAYLMSSKTPDDATTARSLTNIAFTFLSLEQLDSTEIYANKALALSQKIGNRYLIGTALRSLGDVAMKRKDYTTALGKYEVVLITATSLKNTFLEATVLHRIGKLNFEQKRYDVALQYLTQALGVASKYHHKDEMERTCKLIVEVYRGKNDLKRAFDFQTRYVQIHDSLNDQRNSEQVALMQARFDSEIKETKIELLTKDAQLKQEEINSQRVWLYFYIGSLSLFMLLAVVLLYNYHIKRKANLRLKEKNAEIQRQARELGNINGAKDKLFSIISHDLRSPLSSLKGLMDLVIEGVLSKDEFLPVAQNLKHSLESVQENLDNLLYWAQSQLKGLQVNPETFGLRSLVNEKIKFFLEIGRSKNISIVNEIDDDLEVFADKNHVRLVFRNLIANAIKFSLFGGTIVVTQRELDDKVEISVSDTGVGMSSKDVARLFKTETHFSNPGTQKEKGIGIGLLLTKEFIEKNGGSIRVTSELGKGSTFTFTLRRELTGVIREEVLSPSF
jgi:two-component system, sensor histidine kinase and response regulator